jgi:predicted NBD/HSP70 family sugar kinase
MMEVREEIDIQRRPSAGAMLQLIRHGHATTRADLAEQTGFGRSTVAQHVTALLAHKLLVEDAGPSSGGRPVTLLTFNTSAGVALAADLGATHSRVAVSDLAGSVLAETTADLEITLGPDEVLEWVNDRFEELLARAGRRPDEVRGIGIGVPGPIDFAAGCAVVPPIMPGWDGVPLPAYFADRYDAPVLVDNDVNIMALGEYFTNWRDRTEHLLFVKVGTGIGCGIVAGGRIYRGADGAAGDVGHIRVASDREVVCSCGNVNCLEAIAGGQAMARQLAEAGHHAEVSRDVVQLVRQGNVQAVQVVRQAGRVLGEVLASLVNFFNPAAIIIGGDVADADEQLLAGVREVIYSRSLPLATRHLRIARSALEDRAGVTGAAVLAIESALAPAVIDRAIADQAASA